MSDDVKLAVEGIIENIDIVGILTKNAFVSLFILENARRQLENVSLSSKIPGALFGEKLPEEIYQSAIAPTKFVLNLPDWTKPNDAEVNAVILLTNCVEEYELNGVLEPISQTGK